MTSLLAKRLADDLLQVGTILGFEARKEEPVLVESNYCIDVLWRLPLPAGSPFPSANIASIEIQYSDSPTSIGHNIFKAEPTVHPAFHVVISYNTLTNDFKKILTASFPISGLVVLEGEEDVRKLNLWITRFITMKDEENKLSQTGKAILELAKNQSVKYDESTVTEIIREVHQMDIKKVFLPPELGSLLNFLIKNQTLTADRQMIDNAFDIFIDFIQGILSRYGISYVKIPANFLFAEYNIEEEFKDMQVELDDEIEIRQDTVFIRDKNYPLEVTVEEGNACIEAPSGRVCTEPLKAGDLITFVKAASENIEDQLEGYTISEEDRKTLDAIMTALKE